MELRCVLATDTIAIKEAAHCDIPLTSVGSNPIYVMKLPYPLPQYVTRIKRSISPCEPLELLEKMTLYKLTFIHFLDVYNELVGMYFINRLSELVHHWASNFEIEGVDEAMLFNEGLKRILDNGGIPVELSNGDEGDESESR